MTTTSYGTRREIRRETGVSLARGPALILGTILLIAGLFFLYKLHTFPRLSQFPSGTARVDGKAFFHIFGLNGWSGELTAVAGGLLLFGAAHHLLAKTMSLIVGVVLAVIAIIALVNHHSALGLFAANIWTIVGWGVVAALLLVNVLMPRTAGTQVESVSTPVEPVGRRSGAVVATPVRAVPVREPQAVATDPAQVVATDPAQVVATDPAQVVATDPAQVVATDPAAPGDGTGSAPLT